MSRGRTDVAVVGAGIVGLSTAYALSLRRVDFRLFEAARPGAGQSAGRTRIFRHGHARPELVRLAVESRLVWEEWERRLGTPMLGGEGVIVTGPPALERERLLAEAGVPCRLIGPREQERALPIFRAPGGEALLDELGGSTDVRASIEALSRAVSDRLTLGQAFRLGDSPRPVVETSEGIWEAGCVIVCAGAGVRELASGLGVAVPVSIGCHARATFRVLRPGVGAALPSLQDLSGAHGETVYGGPVPGEDAYVVGLSGPDNEVPSGQDGVDALLRRIRRYVERALPGLDPEPIGARLCLTTMLPEGGDTFRIWRAGRVLVLAGDNLFKFGPALGELLADAALGEPIPSWLEAPGPARVTRAATTPAVLAPDRSPRLAGS
ncbi:MAG: FAD-binding oxidoreductase [Thermoleophilaceae bacterium]|nr:FAD-binding oxidoreductase [Thermoleophilaceae bacterium]